MAKQLDQSVAAGVETVAVDDFAALLQKEFKPNTDSKRARTPSLKVFQQSAVRRCSILS